MNTETAGKSVAMSPFGASNPAAKTASKAAPSVSLTSIALIDPPGDTTRASHLMFDENSGHLYAGYKALGADFKGGVDILDASDPTNILDVSSLGADNLDVQEVTYNSSANALYVAGAAKPSALNQNIGGTPALLARVTNFNNPQTELAPLPDNVGKAVVNAPTNDNEHDVYIATDEENVFRFDANLGNEVNQTLQGSEIRSIATTESNVLTVDRDASVFASDVSSANPFSELQTVSSGVGNLAIGRLHARDEPVLNGGRLFLALGSEGLAVLDAANGDVLFRDDGRTYTSVTLHEDDPNVSDEPLDAVYAARPDGIIDVFKINENGVGTGGQNVGLSEVGTFDLSELGGVNVGESPQVNQVMGIGCNIYVANSNEGIVSLRINGGEPCTFDDGEGDENQPPTAQDDSDQTTEGQPTTTDVLANDSDPDGSLDKSTVTVQSGPSDGSVSVDGSTGEVTYTPDSGFTGTDSYTYTVKDGDGAESSEATVTIDVSSGSSPLTLQCPAENDIDGSTGLPEGWPPSNEIGFVGEVRIGDGAGNGAGAATFEYDLSENTSQPDDTGQFDHQDGQTVSFTLTTDSQGNAEFSIGNASDNPLTHTFNFSGTEFDGLMLRARADGGDGVRLEDLTLDGSAVGEDLIFTPGQGDPIQDFLLLSGPNFASGFTLEGTFTLSWDQSVPNNSALAFQIKGYDGPDDPSQFLCSSNGNQAPNAQDDADQTDENQATTTDVLANDNDLDGSLDKSTVTVQSTPSNGSVSVNGQTGEITYTPDSGFTGSDSYTYTVKDGDGAESNEATVSITVNAANQPPTASDESDQTDEGQSTTTDVLANDSDPDGSLDPSTVQVQSGPSDGSVSVDGLTGEITYTPDSGFTGSDSYTYTVKDDDGAESSEATVTITVNDANQPPTANDDSDEVDTPEAPNPPNGAKEISFAAFCTTKSNYSMDDVSIVDTKENGDGEVASIAWTSDTELSTVVLKAGPSSLNYDGGLSGGAASGAGDTAGSGQTPSSPCPSGEVLILKEEDVEGAEVDPTTTTDVLANDSDLDGSLDPATVQVQSGPSDGSVTVNNDGTIDYTPDSGFTGSDSYTYTVKDGDGAESSEATVTITVNSVNTAPTANDDSDDTTEGQSTPTDVLANDSDPDGSLAPSTVAVQSGPSDGSVSVDGLTGEITYTPNSGFTGQDTYTYTVKDNDGAESNEATVTITVNGDDGDDDENTAATAGCSGALGGGVAFTDNGDLKTVPGDGGPVSLLYNTPSSAPVRTLGTGVDLDDDGNVGVVFVQENPNGAEQALKVIDKDATSPTTYSLPHSVKAQKSLLNVGTWEDSGPSAFYVAATGNGDQIFHLNLNIGNVDAIANPQNGVDAIIGIADIDGDGNDELVFSDGSEDTRYVEQDDPVDKSFAEVPDGGAGSNNNIGIGSCLADVDGDGSATVPIVEGSNQIKLVDALGVDDTIVTGSANEQAAKTPLAWADVDDDGTPELVYLENNNSPAELKYVDDVGGANSFKVLRDDDGDRIPADTERGIVSAQ
jgi:hypothetical protein